MKQRITPAALSAAAKGDLDNFLVAATPGGIERQEAQGQRDFCSTESLPIKGTEDRRAWESLGFKFGERGTGDDIFVAVQFPAGWKKVATDHSMWSKLVDDKGRERAAMFYKAAFYDRSAHVSFSRRFQCGTDYDQKEPGKVVVKDCGKVVHVCGTKMKVDWNNRAEATKANTFNDELQAKGEAWLTEHYPDWRNPCAYWD